MEPEKRALEWKEWEGSAALPLYASSLLAACGMVKHAFTTRLGGVSEGIFDSLNFSFSRGDRREAVEENFHRLAAAFGVPYESFVLSDQTHTTNVIRVGAKDRGNGIVKAQRFHDVDGMVTDEAGVTLVTFHADCVPLYFADPVHRAIGLAHSGWRGTVGRMGSVMLQTMQKEFGTKPKDVLCAIGPSICKNCYEVGEDVAAAFQKEFQGKEGQILEEKGDGAYLLDLWQANAVVLREAGILPSHLSIAGVCTCCNPDRFFSHRASRGKRGNLAAVIGLA